MGSVSLGALALLAFALATLGSSQSIRREVSVEPPLWSVGHSGRSAQLTYRNALLGTDQRYLFFPQPLYAVSRVRLIFFSPGLQTWLYREVSPSLLRTCPTAMVQPTFCFCLHCWVPEAAYTPLQFWVQTQSSLNGLWYNVGSVRVPAQYSYYNGGVRSAASLRSAYADWTWSGGRPSPVNMAYAHPNPAFDAAFASPAVVGGGGRVVSSTVLRRSPAVDYRQPVYYEQRSPGKVERYRSSRRVEHLPVYEERQRRRHGSSRHSSYSRSNGRSYSSGRRNDDDDDGTYPLRK